jgi:hypothetical protein
MLIAIAAITGWALITLYRMNLAGQAREQAHRERLAMIDKGLVPPPESDPGQFERMMAFNPGHGMELRADHSRRVGILLVALSVGFAVMMYFLNDDIRRGVGVGAVLFLIGVAFLVNAMFEARSPRDRR